MRAQRVVYFHDRHDVPLTLRSGFPWTFLGVGLFAAINLFLFGLYLLTEAIRDPLQASGPSVVAAGFMLSLAGFMTIYLLWPRAKAVFGHQPGFEFEAHQTSFRKRNASKVFGETLRAPRDSETTLATGSALPRQRAVAALRHEPAPAGSVPPAHSGDAAHARQ